VASSTSVQLRLPLPPWPACANQSRPHGVSILSVAFFTSFCIEIVPSEQVVWLWMSPAAYVPGVLPALAVPGAVPIANAPSAMPTATATLLLRNSFLIRRLPLRLARHGADLQPSCAKLTAETWSRHDRER